MSPTTLPSARRRISDQRTLAGRHVLMLMIAFFGIVFAVNGVLLFKALATHSGLVAQEPYRKGLAYNERIAADEQQQALGWRDTTQLEPDGRVRIGLATPDGRPVSGLRMAVLLGRPSTTRHDVALQLTEQEPGQYESSAGALEAGAWLLSIEARDATAQSPVYRAKRRLWLKP